MIKVRQELYVIFKLYCTLYRVNSLILSLIQRFVIITLRDQFCIDLRNFKNIKKCKNSFYSVTVGINFISANSSFNRFCSRRIRKELKPNVRVDESRNASRSAKRSHVPQKKFVANLDFECYRCSSSTVDSRTRGLCGFEL